MHAPKSSSAKAAPVRAEDSPALDEREVAQLSAERQLDARRAQLLQCEQASAAKLAQMRGALHELTRSRAGGMAVDALGRLPEPPAPLVPPPELAVALEARRAALEARRRAIEAEGRELARREQELARLDSGLASVAQVIAAIHAKSKELLDAERAVEERLRAEKTRGAAAPPPGPPRALQQKAPSPEDKPRPRIASGGALATGLQEAAKPDPAVRERRTRRVALHADVDLFSDSNFYTGFSSDLSDGGIFVATCEVLEAGTEVEVAFTLPGSQRIQSRGVVRWHREYNDRFPDVFPGMGIEFVEMPEESRSAVHAFTSQREPMFWSS
jgi:uncharacterized protein (TIGR02266 family)